MSRSVLCQVNLAHLRYPADHEAVKDFFDGLDAINKLAEEQPGFVWRYQGAYTTENSPWPDDVLPNMSVWQDIETLLDFIYRTAHAHYLVRKKEWFHKMDGPHLALWWAPEGYIPTLAEGKEKLAVLAAKGPSPEAFTLAKRFDPPEAVLESTAG